MGQCSAMRLLSQYSFLTLKRSWVVRAVPDQPAASGTCIGMILHDQCCLHHYHRMLCHAMPCHAMHGMLCCAVLKAFEYWNRQVCGWSACNFSVAKIDMAQWALSATFKAHQYRLALLACCWQKDGEVGEAEAQHKLLCIGCGTIQAGALMSNMTCLVWTCRLDCESAFIDA